jgi:Cof subfamily protein (haloacid dehalogenase superfamily)
VTAAIGDFDLIATDVDGTLLRTDHSLAPRTTAALTAAVTAGAAHVLATGRSVPGCRKLADVLSYTGLIVAANGAQVYDAGADRLVTSMTLDRGVARTLHGALVERFGTAASFAVSTAEIDGRALLTPGFGYDFILPVTTVAEAARLWDEPIVKLYVQHTELATDDLLPLVVELCEPGLVTVVHAGEGLVEVQAAGVSKAVGLRMVARRLGVAAARVVAFGDMPNDIPMLRWAGWGVAMGNAHPELRAVADEIAPSNDEDGVAVVLERLLAERRSA